MPEILFLMTSLILRRIDRKFLIRLAECVV